MKCVEEALCVELAATLTEDLILEIMNATISNDSDLLMCLGDLQLVVTVKVWLRGRPESYRLPRMAIIASEKLPNEAIRLFPPREFESGTQCLASGENYTFLSSPDAAPVESIHKF